MPEGSRIGDVSPVDWEPVYSSYVQKTSPAAAPFGVLQAIRFLQPRRAEHPSHPLGASRLIKRHTCKDPPASTPVRAIMRNATPFRTGVVRARQLLHLTCRGKNPTRTFGTKPRTSGRSKRGT
jgi:hypothetical protein